jgi:cytochrome P450
MILVLQVIMRTISPLQEEIAPLAHRDKVTRLQDDDRLRTEEMMEEAMKGIEEGGSKEANMISVMKASQMQAKKDKKYSAAVANKKNSAAVDGNADDGPKRKGRKQSEGVEMSDDEIRDEILTIRGAGHETTSNTISWALMLLAQNPEKLALLQQEVDELVAGRTATFEEYR